MTNQMRVFEGENISASILRERMTSLISLSLLMIHM